MAVPSALPSSLRPLDEADTDRLRRVFPDLWSDPERTCLICRKTGEYLAPDGKHECDCYDQWTLHWHMLYSGLKTAYQRLTWADLDDQVPASIWEAITDYLDHIDNYVRAGLGMILWGKPGTGKTMISALLFKRLLATGYDGYFTQFNELLDSYTATWRDQDELLWFTRRIRNADILVIDDIGREYKTGGVYNEGTRQIQYPESFRSALFDDVIRHRTGHEKPTIITTNFTQEQLLTGYGGPVLSLLSERSTFHEVTGPDFRSRAKERFADEARQGVVRPFTFGS
jgi:DNA replication protein DnaC